MQHEIFRGHELRAVIASVQKSLGEDAVILRSNVVKHATGETYEVVAVPSYVMETRRRKLTADPVSRRLAHHEGKRPFAIALVGPPGAGKTTAAIKIALHPQGMRGKSVGLVTLDTYRVGAIDEMQTYAEITGMPLEVVYHPREIQGALARLAHVDAIVIDTPGRIADVATWAPTLHGLKPDEVHLVLPAGLRLDVMRAMQARMASLRPTHALLTKLDEVPAEAGLGAMVDALGLPVRWLGDGCDVPGRLIPAGRRLAGPSEPRVGAVTQLAVTV